MCYCWKAGTEFTPDWDNDCTFGFPMEDPAGGEAEVISSLEMHRQGAEEVA